MLNIPKVNEVQALTEYRIKVTYENGEIKIFNVSPYIKGSWYGKLADAATFETVRPAGDTVMWADGQDIAPHELYEDSIPA